MTVTVDALKVTAPGETRVAVTPASVQRLGASETDVLVERDAGAGALLPARTYTTSARVDDAEQLIPRPACTSLTPSRHSAQIMCAIKTLVG
jgi:NAD/NADP transhydrogenase alpha subunit